MTEPLRWQCPDHAAPLTRGAGWECPQGCHFPVTQGIARFVPRSGYTASFGTQWNTWPQTQLDSYSGVTVSRDRLRSSLGPELFADLRDARVLEVGSGAGRFTEVLIAEGALVSSVDLSSAIDVNARNCPPSDQHVLVQADATNLPLVSAQFDVVIALGMVQHTPDPEATVRGLCRHLRPGGWLVIDHYPSGLVHRLRLAQAYRIVWKRMDPDRALAKTRRLHDSWSPRHARARTWLSRKALVLISPIVYFGDGWPQLTPEQKREWGVLDTFDSLTDHYKHRRSLRQVQALFASLPLDDVSVGMIGSVIVARGRSPHE